MAAAQPLRESPWPTPVEREAERRTKREAVLGIAVHLFNQEGFRATSLDDVARRLNVTKPTIYHYFANKDEILFECVRIGLDAIRNAAAPAADGSGDGMSRLKAVIHDYAMVMTRDFGKCVSRTADHELSEKSRLRFKALKREIDQTIRKLVQDGMDDGSIRPGDAKMTTFMITGALNWIARWHTNDGDMSPEEIAAASVDQIVNGLLPHAGRG